jgi:hypothetical protein
MNISIPHEYSIVIDDYKFIIMSKNIPDFNEYIDKDILEQIEQIKDPKKKKLKKNQNTFIEDRYKIYFIVEDKSGKKEDLYAYTSISQMLCWRICFLTYEDYLILEKFHNYKQDTILDLRLQKYIWEVFDELPYATEPHTKYKNPSNTSDGQNPNGIIKCPVFDINNRANIDYMNSDYKIGRRSNMLDMNIFDFKNIYPEITQITELSDLKYDLAICRDYGKYHIKNIIFSVRLENKEIKLSSNEQSIITNPEAINPEAPSLITTKDFPQTLVVQIGVCELKLQTGGKIYSGMYILNLIPDIVTINSYGLYNKYYYDYSSNNFSDDNIQFIDTIVNYHIVSKPLEYKNQVSYRRSDYDKNDDDFGDESYIFIANHNWKKFANNESTEEKDRIEKFQLDLLNKSSSNHHHSNQNSSVSASSSNPANNQIEKFEQKYLKYKTKYIELKNKINSKSHVVL